MNTYQVSPFTSPEIVLCVVIITLFCVLIVRASRTNAH